MDGFKGDSVLQSRGPGLNQEDLTQAFFLTQGLPAFVIAPRTCVLLIRTDAMV